MPAPTRSVLGKLYFNHFDSVDGTTKAGGTWTLETVNSWIKQTVFTIAFAFVNAGQADKLVRGRSQGSANDGELGVGGRINDTSNWAQTWYPKANNAIRLQKKVAGAETTVASAALTIDVSLFHVYQVEVIGDSFESRIDGANTITGTITDFAGDLDGGVYLAPATGEGRCDWLAIYKNKNLKVTKSTGTFSTGQKIKVYKAGSTLAAEVTAAGGETFLNVNLIADTDFAYDKIEITDTDGLTVLDSVTQTDDIWPGDEWSWNPTITAYLDRTTSMNVAAQAFLDRNLSANIGATGYLDRPVSVDMQPLPTAFLDRPVSVSIGATAYFDRNASLYVGLLGYFDRAANLDVVAQGYLDRPLSVNIFAQGLLDRAVSVDMQPSYPYFGTFNLPNVLEIEIVNTHILSQRLLPNRTVGYREIVGSEGRRWRVRGYLNPRMTEDKQALLDLADGLQRTFWDGAGVKITNALLLRPTFTRRVDRDDWLDYELELVEQNNP